MIKKIITKFFSKEVKSGTMYVIATLFSRGLAFITVPIFTRIMTTDQIGKVNLYNSWYSVISVIATLSLTSGGFAVAMMEFKDERDEYISSVLSLTSIIAIIIGLIYFINMNFWNDLLGLPTELMVLMICGFLFAPARDFWLARKRYEYEYKVPSLIIFISALIASLLSIIIVLYEKNNGIVDTAIGRLFGNYVVLYGVAFIIWINLFRKGKVFYNKKFWKTSLYISIPLIGYSIATQILNVSDRAMISHYINDSAVGIYGTLYTVSSISLLVWQAINSSFVPYMFRNIKDNKLQNIRKHSYELLFLYSIVSMCLTCFAPEIVKTLATSEYYEAVYIMPPIAAGIFFTSLAQMYSNVCVYYKKTKYVMYPAAIAAIFNIILNMFFIPKYGYMAAAYTTLVSYIIWAMCQILFSNSVAKKANYENKKIFNDKKLLLLSFLTLIINLLCLTLYKMYVIRYTIIIFIIILFIFIFIRKVLKKKEEL